MAANRTFSGSARRDDGPTPPKGSARAEALRLLSRRDYTTSEIRERLLERGHAADDIDRTLSDLTTEGNLDDRRVAATHARTALAVKGRGRFRVKRELQARGIASDVADEALASLDAGAEAEAVRRILVRKRFPQRPSPEERRRMIQHLLRRGYASDLIYRTIGRGRGEPDDPSDW